MEEVEHPLTIKPSKNAYKVEQPDHEQLGPLPARYILVAPSSFGKSLAANTIAEALLPVMGRCHIFFT